MEVVGAVSGVLGVGQAMVLHRDALEKSLELHREAISQAERFHQQSMDFDLLSAMRENSRDIWAQKNNTTDTLMFSCGFAIIIEGMPPEDSPTWVLNLFSFTVSSAICMLFLSTWLAMKLQVRMSKYNIFDVNGKYNCGRPHPNFKGYYHCHCRHITRWGYRLFYMGTFQLVACAALLLWQRFDLLFKAKSAGMVFAAVGGATVILLIVLQILLPAGTRQSTLVTSKSIQRELKRIMKESSSQSRGPHRRAGQPATAAAMV